jgi:hypothetical protein
MLDCHVVPDPSPNTIGLQSRWDEGAQDRMKQDETKGQATNLLFAYGAKVGPRRIHAALASTKDQEQDRHDPRDDEDGNESGNQG